MEGRNQVEGCSRAARPGGGVAKNGCLLGSALCNHSGMYGEIPRGVET